MFNYVTRYAILKETNKTTKSNVEIGGMDSIVFEDNYIISTSLIVFKG